MCIGGVCVRTLPATQAQQTKRKLLEAEALSIQATLPQGYMLPMPPIVR